MKKLIVPITSLMLGLPTLSYADSNYFSVEDDNFKRFSISAGWLHGSPHGKPNPVQMSTAATGTNYKNNNIKTNTIPNYIAKTKEGDVARQRYKKLIDETKQPNAFYTFPNNVLTSDISGITQINSLENWTNPNSGFKAKDFDALGVMLNYHLTENISVALRLNSPSQVKLEGVGQINMPIEGFSLLQGKSKNPRNAFFVNSDINAVRSMPLNGRIPVSNLEKHQTAANMRAWLPAIEMQYQFGKAGVNKFRPYVGAGIMLSHFSGVKLDKGVEKDFIKVGHVVKNLMDQKAGAALEGATSSADPRVSMDTNSKLAPMLTLGATYDFDQNWFAVASVSYAKFNNTAEITIRDEKTFKVLGTAKTKIKMDPFMTYVGVGYRF
ncbi:OmpW/AlkL family protein [Acinetobacter equi]|uniref:OmpW family protein n=1 Tax=Acinetobacter equi TaxID=1324350 RepID=A0A0N9VZK7_9GAMM|nr:OmpW family outer membrane protein [Acinetobacter equi]ALH95631.1 hypothetical protein AOY20_08875 [Acinetobacter equi]